MKRIWNKDMEENHLKAFFINVVEWKDKFEDIEIRSILKR